MKKATKITLWIACGMLILGLALYIAAVITTGQFGLYRQELLIDSPEDLETKTVTIQDSFQNIRVEELSCDVRIAPSPDGTCSVIYPTSKRYTHTATVSGDTLTVRGTSVRSFMNFFSIVLGTQEVVIYLPFDEIDDLSITSVSGDISVPEGFSIETLTVKSTSGDIALACQVSSSASVKTTSGEIELDHCNPQSLTCSSTSGDLSVNHVAAGTLEISTVSGEIDLEDITADEEAHLSSTSGNIRFIQLESPYLSARTVSGDVYGTVPTAKDILTQTTSGNVKISGSQEGQPQWRITTTSGNIRVSVEPD